MSHRCLLHCVCLQLCECSRVSFIWQVGSTYADLSLRKRLSALTAKQKNDEGDVVPLVAPGGEAPTIWKIAAEDVAAKK